MFWGPSKSGGHMPMAFMALIDEMALFGSFLRYTTILSFMQDLRALIHESNLPIAVDFPKKMLTTAISFSNALYNSLFYKQNICQIIN